MSMSLNRLMPQTKQKGIVIQQNKILSGHIFILKITLYINMKDKR